MFARVQVVPRSPGALLTWRGIRLAYFEARPYSRRTGRLTNSQRRLCLERGALILRVREFPPEVATISDRIVA